MFLSTTAAVRSKPTRVFRKADCCLSCSYLHPLYANPYKTLCHACAVITGEALLLSCFSFSSAEASCALPQPAYLAKAIAQIDIATLAA